MFYTHVQDVDIMTSQAGSIHDFHVAVTLPVAGRLGNEVPSSLRGG